MSHGSRAAVRALLAPSPRWLHVAVGLIIAFSPLVPFESFADPAVAAPAPSAAPAKPETPVLPWAETRRHGLAEPKARTPGAFRFASYNIENLFDDKDDPKLSGSAEDASMTKPEEDCKNAALAIRLIDADVLCLEEVESLDAVKWFRDKYLSGLGYDFVESLDAGDGRGIEQAVLSRFPLSNASVWPNQTLEGTHPRRRNAEKGAEGGAPIKLHRSPLRVDVTVPAGNVKDAAGKGNEKDYHLSLMVLHHKSGRPSGYWREAEAKQFIKWAKEIEAKAPGTNLIICGDFNARAGDASMRMYFDAGYVDSFVAGGVKRSPGPEGSPAGDTGDDDDAPSARGGKARGPIDPTVISHASEQTIDFILMNANAAKELFPSSPFVLGTGARPLGADFRKTPKPAGWASDHYPLVIDLTPIDK